MPHVCLYTYVLCTNPGLILSLSHTASNESSYSIETEHVKSWLEDLKKEVLAENPDWYKYGIEAYPQLSETVVKALPDDLSTSEFMP